MTLNSFDQLSESLSAMVDDEASELEMRRVLMNMDSNPEIIERWRRYHLIGSVMRKEHSLGIANPTSLVSSISNTLDNEVEATASAPAAAKHRSGSGALRDLLGKTAIAASFAATLVMGFNYMGTMGEGGLGEGNATIATGPSAPAAEQEPAALATHVPIGFELPLPEARAVSMTSGSSAAVAGAVNRQVTPIYLDDITDYETQEMLNYLLIQHAERASAHGSLGIMPFARVHKMRAESAK